MKREDLVQDWIRYHSGQRKGDDPSFAAWQEVDDLVRRDPEAAWDVVLLLVAAAPDDAVLANVAAGPLEDLIKTASELVVDRVEMQARRDPKFRRCLTGVWGIPDGIRERLAKYTATVPDPL